MARRFAPPARVPSPARNRAVTPAIPDPARSAPGTANLTFRPKQPHRRAPHHARSPKCLGDRSPRPTAPGARVPSAIHRASRTRPVRVCRPISGPKRRGGDSNPRWTDSPYRFSRPEQTPEIAHKHWDFALGGTKKGTTATRRATSFARPTGVPDGSELHSFGLQDTKRQQASRSRPDSRARAGSSSRSCGKVAS
jgi:hypothetical protein